YVKEWADTAQPSDRHEATPLQLSRSKNRHRSRRFVVEARYRQAAGGREIADADAEFPLRSARPYHRSQPGRGALLHPRDARGYGGRRQDRQAVSGVLRAGGDAVSPYARGDPKHRPPPDTQSWHHRGLAVPSRSRG